MSVDVTITPGTTRFDPEDQRWRDQVAALHAALVEDVGPVSRRAAPVAGTRGALDTTLIALGSSGALTAAVASFRAWLSRDKTRTLTLTWTDGTGTDGTGTDGTGTEQRITVTGENIDHASFQALAEAVGRRLGER